MIQLEDWYSEMIGGAMVWERRIIKPKTSPRFSVAFIVGREGLFKGSLFFYSEKDIKRFSEIGAYFVDIEKEQYEEEDLDVLKLKLDVRLHEKGYKFNFLK